MACFARLGRFFRRGAGWDEGLLDDDDEVGDDDDDDDGAGDVDCKTPRTAFSALLLLLRKAARSSILNQANQHDVSNSIVSKKKDLTFKKMREQTSQTAEETLSAEASLAGQAAG